MKNFFPMEIERESKTYRMVRYNFDRMYAEEQEENENPDLILD